MRSLHVRPQTLPDPRGREGPGARPAPRTPPRPTHTCFWTSSWFQTSTTRPSKCWPWKDRGRRAGLQEEGLLPAAGRASPGFPLLTAGPGREAAALGPGYSRASPNTPWGPEGLSLPCSLAPARVMHPPGGQPLHPRRMWSGGSPGHHLGHLDDGPAELLNLILAVQDALKVLVRPVLEPETGHWGQTRRL